MAQIVKKYVNALIKLEPIFKQASEMSLELRSTVDVKKKLNTGIDLVDIVTEADLLVQETILVEAAKTVLKDCILVAEEKTPSVKKFKGSNNLTLALDPIDGTFLYTSNGRLFNTQVSLKSENKILYTFCHYPAVKWSMRMSDDGVLEFGKKPRATVKTRDNLSKSIMYTTGDPAIDIPDIYKKLTGEGYIFRYLFDITDDAGSTTLFLLDQAGGYYKNMPQVCDGLTAYHYAQVKNYQIFSNLNISKLIAGKGGTDYYKGWYIALK